MRNKVGKDAFVTNGIMIENLGKRVQVVGYIGYFNAGEKFEYNGMHMAVPITDNYFWIFSKEGLSTPLGETSKAFGPDSWLMPIDSDDDLSEIEKKELQLNRD